MSEVKYTVNNDDGTRQLMDHKTAWENVTQIMDTRENAEEKQKAMIGFLQGIRSEVELQNVSRETFSSYGSDYKDLYTDAERKKLSSKKGTELWQKKRNAEFVEKQERLRREKMNSRAKTAVKKAGLRENHFSHDIMALSAFMGNSTKDNVSLIRAYRGEEKSKVIRACIKKFMKLDLGSLDIRSNNKVAENAEKLERLSELFTGIQYLITESPDVYAALPEKIRLSFEEYYGKASNVVTYYRLKKQVMLDEYFITHENREIGSEISNKLSSEQMNLTEMVWQSAGGLAIFLNRSNDYLLNGTLKSLKESLREKGTEKNRLDLQKKLRLRRKELEAKGIAGRMDEFLMKERRLDVKGKLGIVGHARNLRAFDLTGDPEKDIDLLPGIIDQREILEKADSMKEKSRNSYYLEQSDHQIAVADTALSMLDTLKRLEEDLLTLGRLTRGGAIDTSVTREKISLCKERYSEDLAEYKEKMAGLKAARQAKYEIREEESPDKAEYKAPVKGEADPLNEAKILIVKLTRHKFSDVDIYNNRDYICALSKICKEPEVSDILDALAKRAVVVWEEKRLLNVRAALKRDKDNEALKSEDKRLSDKKALRGKHRDENGNPVDGKDDTIESMLKLRADAEKKKFDFRDLKAQAMHYTDQYDWALNSRGEGGGFLLWLGSGVLKGLFKYFGSDRNLAHGEEKYDEAVERLERMPREIMEHQDGTGFTLQRGDEAVPPLDIADLYEDRMKDDLKRRIAEVRGLLQGREENYPEELKTAVSAMENYVKIKYIVTTDTTEMEMAFLDKFQKDMRRAVYKIKNIDYGDGVVRGLIEIMNDITDMGRGKLRDRNNPERITDAEFAAAIEQKAVFIKHSGDDLEESNVKDIPLFLHKPNINDIKQGYVGDCYFLSAITAYMRSNPDGIENMFYDIGDGNVLVKLYMGFDENNRRVDNPEEMLLPEVTMRPVFIKVRKDYDIGATAQDCMWVQLLEKAYTSTGTQHKNPKVNRETGEIGDFACEIAAGLPQKVMMHLTGRKDCWNNQKPEKEEIEFEDRDMDVRRMRQFLNGVPAWIHYQIWDSIKKDNSAELKNEDEWIDSALEQVKKAVREANDFRKEQLKTIREDILKIIKKEDEKELDRIEKKIEEVYYLDPEKTAEQVMKNILTESPEIDDGTGLADPSAVIGSLYEKIDGGMSFDEIFESIGQSDTFYEKPKHFLNETEENYTLRIKALDVYAKNRNKAMMEMNPDGRYTREEMIFLHDIRMAKRRGEGMTIAIPLHAMDILDVRYKSGRWFVLVRDTNNVRNLTYEKDETGELKIVKTKKGKFEIKRKVRTLNGNLANGVYGSSWWDLKDIFAQLDSYGNAPKTAI